MSTQTIRGAVAVRDQQQAKAVGAFDPADAKVLAYLGLNPTDPKSRAVVAVARHYRLDPLLKHIIVLPKGGVYITRDGYLHVAHESGQFDGMEVVEGPVLMTDEWHAKVAVYRKDMGRPFVYVGRYPVQGSNTEFAQEMAVTRAERRALKRAFNIPGEDNGEIGTEQSRYSSGVVTQAPSVERVDRETGEILDGQVADDGQAETAPDGGEGAQP